jgi:hypothetical protein
VHSSTSIEDEEEQESNADAQLQREEGRMIPSMMRGMQAKEAAHETAIKKAMTMLDVAMKHESKLESEHEAAEEEAIKAKALANKAKEAVQKLNTEKKEAEATVAKDAKRISMLEAALAHKALLKASGKMKNLADVKKQRKEEQARKEAAAADEEKEQEKTAMLLVKAAEAKAAREKKEKEAEAKAAEREKAVEEKKGKDAEEKKREAATEAKARKVAEAKAEAAETKLTDEAERIGKLEAQLAAKKLAQIAKAAKPQPPPTATSQEPFVQQAAHDALLEREAAEKQVASQAERIGKLEAALAAKGADGGGEGAGLGAGASSGAGATGTGASDGEKMVPFEIAQETAGLFSSTKDPVASSPTLSPKLREQHCAEFDFEPCKAVILAGPRCEMCMKRLAISCMDSQINMLCNKVGGADNDGYQVSADQLIAAATAIGKPKLSPPPTPVAVKRQHVGATQRISSVKEYNKRVAAGTTTSQRQRQVAGQLLQRKAQASAILSQVSAGLSQQHGNPHAIKKKSAGTLDDYNSKVHAVAAKRNAERRQRQNVELQQAYLHSQQMQKQAPMQRNSGIAWHPAAGQVPDLPANRLQNGATQTAKGHPKEITAAQLTKLKAKYVPKTRQIAQQQTGLETKSVPSKFAALIKEGTERGNELAKTLTPAAAEELKRFATDQAEKAAVLAGEKINHHSHNRPQQTAEPTQPQPQAANRPPQPMSLGDGS